MHSPAERGNGDGTRVEGRDQNPSGLFCRTFSFRRFLRRSGSRLLRRSRGSFLCRSRCSRFLRRRRGGLFRRRGGWLGFRLLRRRRCSRFLRRRGCWLGFRLLRRSGGCLLRRRRFGFRFLRRGRRSFRTFLFGFLCRGGNQSSGGGDCRDQTDLDHVFYDLLTRTERLQKPVHGNRKGQEGNRLVRAVFPFIDKMKKLNGNQSAG